jgi:hypothetical protein
MNTYIIGNGFDLCLGINTSYSNYYKSNYFRELTHSSPIAKYINELNHKREMWVDFEEALKSYCESSLRTSTSTERTKLLQEENIKLFNDHFTVIKKSIQNFIAFEESKRDLTNILKENTALKIVKDMVDDFEKNANTSAGFITNNDRFKIITFNYTNSLLELLEIESRSKWGVTNGAGQKWQNNFEKLKESIVTIHGSLLSNNIIVGIEDVKDSIPKETYQIRKSLHVDYSSFSLEQLKTASKVIIFGHSLGKSDQMYFKRLFDLWHNNSNKDRRRIEIYFKQGIENRIYFNNRILELIDYNSSSFREINDYHLIEVN